MRKRKNHLLHILSHVIADHHLKPRRSISFHDLDGKLEGKIMNHKYGHIAIQGWKGICRRNNVGENDRIICKFLLSTNKPVSLRFTLSGMVAIYQFSSSNSNHLLLLLLVFCHIFYPMKTFCYTFKHIVQSEFSLNPNEICSFFIIFHVGLCKFVGI